MSNRTICLINDSFPPVTDGVANAVVNYGRAITESGDKAVVVTPAYPGADDSGFSFPVVRYPSIDMTKLVGYHAGFLATQTARPCRTRRWQKSDDSSGGRMARSCCSTFAGSFPLARPSRLQMRMQCVSQTTEPGVP